MEVLKRRLNEFREEEDELRNRIEDLEIEIKKVIENTHKVNAEHYELVSKEMLLKQKCESQNARLKNALSRLSDQTNSHSQHTRKLENLSNKNDSQDSRIDELEAELSRLRAEQLEVQSRLDETILHLKHVEFAKDNAEKRAAITESKLQDLEKQHVCTADALRLAELNDMQYLSTDDLEMKEKNLREQLQVAIDTYENSERNIATLDCQIKARKAELLKQQNENESLKKEIDCFLKEMVDM
uniref:Tropomyosin n=1 Tax=Trichobilharzia regenti TaxID=157069 RepID=A0AA85KKL8_TRIRE|nr:unnamed protein product [Trichobilharzia regenti]